MILRPFTCGVHARLVLHVRHVVSRDCTEPCMLSRTSLLVAYFGLAHCVWVMETARRVVVT